MYEAPSLSFISKAHIASEALNYKQIVLISEFGPHFFVLSYLLMCDFCHPHVTAFLVFTPLGFYWNFYLHLKKERDVVGVGAALVDWYGGIVTHLMSTMEVLELHCWVLWILNIVLLCYKDVPSLRIMQLHPSLIHILDFWRMFSILLKWDISMLI